MKKLYITRGVPTSGKSYLAIILANGDKSKVFSTDDYFEQMPGGYLTNWCLEKLHKAHLWNQDRVKKAMEDGINPIVAANTNIKIREIKPYVEMALQNNYIPELIEPHSPWWLEISKLLDDKNSNSEKIEKWADKLANGFEYEDKIIKNVHGVPKEVIHKMLNSFNKFTIEDVLTAISQSKV